MGGRHISRVWVNRWVLDVFMAFEENGELVGGLVMIDGLLYSNGWLRFNACDPSDDARSVDITYGAPLVLT